MFSVKPYQYAITIWNISFACHLILMLTEMLWTRLTKSFLFLKVIYFILTLLLAY